LKFESLPDDHPRKPLSLFQLSRLFRNRQVAQVLILRDLADVNRMFVLRKEGMQCAEEALKISKQLGDTVKQACRLNVLAWLLHDDERLDAAKEAASHHPPSCFSTPHPPLSLPVRERSHLYLSLHLLSHLSSLVQCPVMCLIASRVQIVLYICIS